MRRNDAENLIGKLVITDIVNGGLYIGELLKIIPSKPFRANVRVKGIYRYPFLYNHNTSLTFVNKIIIHKENEIVNTASLIKEFRGDLISYNVSLKNSLLKYSNKVNQTLSCYENDINFYSYYIGNIVDCIKLKELLKERLKQIS